VPELDVAATGRHLERLAGHFAPRDWDYTRTGVGGVGPSRIVYPGAWSGYGRLDRRLWRALAGCLWRRNVGVGWDVLADTAWGRRWVKPVRYLLHVWVTLRVELGTDTHLPDGHLAGGSILTFWEEDGEYLNLAQPSVGLLVAKFLQERPDDPHAVAIATEVSRLVDRYATRVDAGKVDGTARAHKEAPA